MSHCGKYLRIFGLVDIGLMYSIGLVDMWGWLTLEVLE